MVQPGDELQLRLDYRPDLFDAATVATLGARLIRLLEAVAADAERPLGALPILEAAERDTILRAWNDTATLLSAATGAGCSAARRRRCRQLFAAQAARTPDAIAVMFEDRTLSYAALDAHANRLAHHLRGLGVGPETVVGLLVERSPEMVIGLHRHPQGRRRLPAARSAISARAAGLHAGGRRARAVLVTQAALIDRLADAVAAGTAMVRLDADWPAIARHPAAAPARAPSTRAIRPTSSTPRAQPEPQRASW